MDSFDKPNYSRVPVVVGLLLCACTRVPVSCSRIVGLGVGVVPYVAIGGYQGTPGYP